MTRMCECGYRPKSTTPKRYAAALWKHRSARRCAAFAREPAVATTIALLSPKNGRFDSAAALDVLMGVWR